MWKVQIETDKQEREPLSAVLTVQMLKATRMGSGPKRGAAGTQSSSPTWVTEIQPLKPSLLPPRICTVGKLETWPGNQSYTL